MAFNILSGSIVAPKEFGPLKRHDGHTRGANAAQYTISGSLVGDGTEIENVPRIVANPDQYNLLTVGTNENSLIGEGNLTFDGQTLSVYGDTHFAGSVVYNFVSVASDGTQPSGTYNINPSDYYIAIDTTAGPVNVELPPASGLAGGHTYIIKDQTGNAETNNITISTKNSDLIDGTNSVTLRSPHAAIQVFCNGVDRYLIF